MPINILTNKQQENNRMILDIGRQAAYIKARRERGYEWAKAGLSNEDSTSVMQSYLESITDIFGYDVNDFYRGALAALRDYIANKQQEHN